MADIQWRYTVPSEGSKVGIGANDIRHQKRQIGTVLDVSFNVGDDANPVKQGAALPIFQAASKNSYGFGSEDATNDHWYATGRIFIESDTSRVYSYLTIEDAVGISNTSCMLGSPNHIEHGDTTYTRATWVERSDFYEAVSSGEHTIDLQINRGGITGEPQGFDGIPVVIVSAHTTASTSVDTTQVQVIDVQRDKFTIYVQGAEVQVHWTSIGTVSNSVGGQQ